MSTATTLKPGQTITCTLEKVPLNEGARQTIAKLMRKDLTNKRNLRKAQSKRRQRMVIYNRGNRDWVSRETVARVVHVVRGATWTMVYTPDLSSEFNCINQYIKIA
jgi:hypothetical protein